MTNPTAPQPAPTGLPPLPARAEELLRAVFVHSDKGGENPPPPVVAEANAYRMYVQQLAVRLDHESRRLALVVRDEAELVRANQELLQIERSRHAALQPYLAPAQNDAEQGLPPGWLNLRRQLREQIAKELEVVRDARVRLEFRRAEMINQRPGIQARIVVRGGAQIKLHFSRRTGHATEKT